MRIDLEIRRKSTISDGNPDDSAETLRKSLIAVLGGELTGRGKYQPEIQFPEGEELTGGGKSTRYIRYFLANISFLKIDHFVFWYKRFCQQSFGVLCFETKHQAQKSNAKTSMHKSQILVRCHDIVYPSFARVLMLIKKSWGWGSCRGRGAEPWICVQYYSILFNNSVDVHRLLAQRRHLLFRLKPVLTTVTSVLAPTRLAVCYPSTLLAPIALPPVLADTCPSTILAPTVLPPVLIDALP